VRVKLSPGGPVRALALDEYARGVLVAEAGVSTRDGLAGERMLEVQAIIARTYAVAHLSRHAREGFDLCSATHCQVYDPRRLETSGHAGAVRNAVGRTTGMVLWHRRRPASTVFHADCGGHTSAARDVWGGQAHPYLTARRDDGPAEAAHRAWRFDVGHEAMRLALNRDVRTRVGRRFLDIAIVSRDQAGRAIRVRLDGSTAAEASGEQLRAVVNGAFGHGALLSTLFDVRRSGDGFRFEGRGYGHGVGLCQVGALARLRGGASVAVVLARYYPGTRLGVTP